MEISTSACIFIDKSSPVWPKLQELLADNDSNFASCKDVTLHIVDDNTLSKFDLEIGELLQSMGVPTHVHGFRYLIEAIEVVYYDSHMLEHVTKDLYPFLARRLHTTRECVERNIRQAVYLTWKTPNLRVLQSVFSGGWKTRPTISEFLSVVSNYLHYQHCV